MVGAPVAPEIINMAWRVWLQCSAATPTNPSVAHPGLKLNTTAPTQFLQPRILDLEKQIIHNSKLILLGLTLKIIEIEINGVSSAVHLSYLSYIIYLISCVGEKGYSNDSNYLNSYLR